MKKYYVPPSLAKPQRYKSFSKATKVEPQGYDSFAAYGGRDVWRALSAKAKARDNFTCAKCQTRYPQSQLEAHHIVPLARGGSNCLANLMTLCHAHHHALHDYMTSVVSSRARRSSRR